MYFTVDSSLLLLKIIIFANHLKNGENEQKIP